MNAKVIIPTAKVQAERMEELERLEIFKIIIKPYDAH